QARRRLAEVARRRGRCHAAARSPDAPLASAQVRGQELASEGGRRSSCKARSERVNTHRPAVVNWGNLTRPRMGEFKVAAGAEFQETDVNAPQKLETALRLPLLTEAALESLPIDEIVAAHVKE